MTYTKYLGSIGKFAAIAVVSAGGGSLLKGHFVDVADVTGESMAPTLSPRYHETGQKYAMLWDRQGSSIDNVRVGDVILFTSPLHPDSVVVKRVVAMGGDQVVLDPKRDPGYGKRLDELQPETRIAAERWLSYKGNVTIPYGHIWVEGDNWRASRDSNTYGPISKSLILGRAWLGLWPREIFLQKPWENYTSTTKVVAGSEILPPEWQS